MRRCIGGDKTDEVSTRGWLGWVALGGTLVACGGEVETVGATRAEPARAYTGSLSSTDADIALVEQGGQVRAYVCGGELTYATLSRWFTLTTSPGAHGESEVRGEADGWRLEGTLTASGAQGWLRGPDGEAARSWQARVVEDEVSGLYERREEVGVLGAIVQRREAVADPEVQGVLLGRAGYRAQVTPVRPLGAPDHLQVTVTIDAVRQVRELRRVSPGR